VVNGQAEYVAGGESVSESALCFSLYIFSSDMTMSHLTIRRLKFLYTVYSEKQV
jgi:hypothetical protein